MIKALVLTGDGINCEEETAFALSQAGAHSEIMHVNLLIESPQQLQEYQILALPGGFSFGDEISSGKVLAVKMQHALGEALYRFIGSDKLIIGVCNGFQALVKLGVLPVSSLRKQQVTLAHNRQKRFINRWVSMKVPRNTLFFEGLDDFMLPIRHGEGRLLLPEAPENKTRQVEADLEPHVALVYSEDVNGSVMQIAGLVNERGNVLGLMPHPEAFVRWTQHPAWTSLSANEKSKCPPGKQVFLNMMKALRN